MQWLKNLLTHLSNISKYNGTIFKKNINNFKPTVCPSYGYTWSHPTITKIAKHGEQPAQIVASRTILQKFAEKRRIHLNQSKELTVSMQITIPTTTNWMTTV